MMGIELASSAGRPLRVLALGAHCDDIEIGCGGTILAILAARPDVEVSWNVFCSTPGRAAEARAAAAAFLQGARAAHVTVRDFRDGFLPYAGAAVKEEFEGLKSAFSPDLVFTHYREDRHQDHRVISDLTWNTWRNHLVLEYEIPKYDGDFGAPNVFWPLSSATVERKIDLVLEHFRSQEHRQWFTRDLLRAVPRVRGMECAATEQVAEAFYGRKLVF